MHGQDLLLLVFNLSSTHPPALKIGGINAYCHAKPFIILAFEIIVLQVRHEIPF